MSEKQVTEKHPWHILLRGTVCLVQRVEVGAGETCPSEPEVRDADGWGGHWLWSKGSEKVEEKMEDTNVQM